MSTTPAPRRPESVLPLWILCGFAIPAAALLWRREGSLPLFPTRDLPTQATPAPDPAVASPAPAPPGFDVEFCEIAGTEGGPLETSLLIAPRPGGQGVFTAEPLLEQQRDGALLSSSNPNALAVGRAHRPLYGRTDCAGPQPPVFHGVQGDRVSFRADDTLWLRCRWETWPSALGSEERIRIVIRDAGGTPVATATEVLRAARTGAR
jgi:hypothetical protein